MAKENRKKNNSSELKEDKKFPKAVSPGKDQEFERSKLRNKGKGSNENLGGSLNDHQSLEKKKRRLK
jgi:hypothetical protein